MGWISRWHILCIHWLVVIISNVFSIETYVLAVSALKHSMHPSIPMCCVSKPHVLWIYIRSVKANPNLDVC